MAPPAGQRAPLVLVAVGAGLAVLALVVGLVVADARDAGRGLPDTLAGMPAQDAGPGGLAEQLRRRIASEPAVEDVAVRAYGRDGTGLVVLDLTPRSPLTDETAGTLTTRLLGSEDPDGEAGGTSSAVSDDGLALVTCRSTATGAATCVSVESDRALVVLSTGDDRDPVGLASAVRDEVRADR